MFFLNKVLKFKMKYLAYILLILFLLTTYIMSKIQKVTNHQYILFLKLLLG